MEGSSPQPRNWFTGRRDFLDCTDTLHIDRAGITCALNLRSHPALIDDGFAELQTPIPLRDGRTLKFRFPPR
jgi:hypothetical protein